MKKELTAQQRKKIERFVLYPLVGLIALLVLYLLFRPSSEEEGVQNQGFNTEITAGSAGAMVDDKTKAYENDILSKKEQERNYLKDLGAMLTKQDKEQGDTTTEELYLDDRRTDVQPTTTVSKAERTITASTNAYRDINRNLNDFYSTPKKDVEKEQMQKRIEELEAQQTAQMQQQQPQVPTMDEQMALLEKSYELAAKYGGQQGGKPNSNSSYTPPIVTQEESNYKNGKAQIANIKQVREQTVSRLSQPISNEEFMEQYSQPRQMGFNTAVGKVGLTTKNTIAACVHADQTITDGQAVRLRLIEPMIAGDKIMPKGSMITGIGKVQGERLFINVTMLEFQGTITPVELIVADFDGQEGIFIPNSMEVSAVKEVVANLGGSMGTTINLNQQSAGDQILTDLGKGAIQGFSQYVANKVREVKVHLKAGHRLMLYQEETN